MKAKALLFPLLLAASCSGIHAEDGIFTAHAETLVLFGWETMGDDFTAAHDEVKSAPGLNIVSISSSPDDWSSFIGIMNNIIGIHCTQISGTYTEQN